MRRRPALVLGPTVLLTLALAAPASADFCVPGPCAPGVTAAPTLQDAINGAAGTTGPDTITVAAGTFAGGIAGVGNPVNVVGAGRLVTTLNGGAMLTPVLALDDPGSSVSALRVSVDAIQGIGVRSSGSATDLLVDGPDGIGNRRGVQLRGGGTLERSTVTLPIIPGSQSSIGVDVDGAGAKTLADVSVSAEAGVTVSNAASLAVRSSRIAASQGVSLIGATATLDDVLLVVATTDTPPSFGALVEDSSATEITLRNTTVWGPGSGSGVMARDGAKAHLLSTVVRNFVTDLDNTTGVVDANYSGYATATGTIGGNAATNIVGPGDPGFVNAAGGDFRLPYNSVLVDNGDPGPVPGPTTDLAGGARLVNGRVDIGAYEYQRRPPVPAIAVSEGQPKVDDPVGFDASGSSDGDPGDAPLSFSWAFDDGAAASGPAVQHAFATAGSHRVTLTVTDPAGVSASLSRLVVIDAKGGGGLLPPVPSLTSFTNANSSFAVARSKARAAGDSKKKAKPPKRGTTFRYTLSGAAKSVKISFTALVAGKKSGRSCVKPTKRLKRAKNCTRSVAKGGIEGPAAAGRNTLAWNGRVKRKALAAGRYKATARATDRVGRLSNSRTLTFTIVAAR